MALGMNLIKGPLHHQIVVRISALIGIAAEIAVLFGFSTNWQFRFMAWDLERQIKRRQKREGAQ